MTFSPGKPATAALFTPLGEGVVRCDLCHHRCRIEPGERGLCCVRENRDGELLSLAHGRLVSANVDPIEKKPLFHVQPGSRSLSVATVGCNLRCAFCQNHSIAAWPRRNPGQDLPGELRSPEEVAEAAAAAGCASISYTYTEPTVFWEWVRDTAEAAHRLGLLNCLVTNGYMTTAALDFMGDLIDAANVDLKGLAPGRLVTVTGARPGPVVRNIENMRRRGVWVEVTTLIVPGLNDGEDELRGISRLLGELDPDIPWHVSRFQPSNEMSDLDPTPPETIRQACGWGREAGLRYVYAGNLWGDDSESTRCPACSELLIQRRGFRLGVVSMEGGRCGTCGEVIAGLRMP